MHLKPLMVEDMRNSLFHNLTDWKGGGTLG